MGQCIQNNIQEEHEINISDTSLCIICNTFSSNDKPMFVCPSCNTVIGHMDCVTFWIIIHKQCPYCSTTLFIKH